jgi:hypothetical protein
VDKIRNPHLKTLIFHVNGLLAADDKHRNLFQPAVLSDFLDNRKTIHFGHLQIQQQCRCFLLIFPQPAYRFLSVFRRFYLIFIFKHIAQHFAVYFRVIHDQNPAPHKNPPFFLCTQYQCYFSINLCRIPSKKQSLFFLFLPNEHQSKNTYTAVTGYRSGGFLQNDPVKLHIFSHFF